MNSTIYYKAGKIKPLPEGVPLFRAIEVHTKKRSNFMQDAKDYYKRLKDSADAAIKSIDKGETSSDLYNSAIETLKQAIYEEVTLLEARLNTNIPDTVRRFMQIKDKNK